MNDSWLVGVDLGGTTVKLAFVSAYGEILHKWEIPTDKSGKTVTVSIAKAIDSKLNEPRQTEAHLKMDRHGRSRTRQYGDRHRL